MALTYSEKPEFGSVAPDFNLPGVDGKNYSLADFKGSKALAVIFMCNHCPYVQAVEARISRLARKYAARGVQFVAINPNDIERYPDDDMEHMSIRSQEREYIFPYLRDDSQEVARAYKAMCTPDPYVYENVEGRFLLRYHGRIDDNWKDESAVTRNEMDEALDALVSGREVSQDQKPAMGCGIKWIQ